MLRNLSAPIVKALLLGFFCCLGTSAKTKDVEEPKAELLSLRAVHPDNKRLVAGIKAGLDKIPSGYQLFPLTTRDYKTGKKTGEVSILLNSKTIVTERDVKVAHATDAAGTIGVTLSKSGGKKLAKATKEMKLGVDRLAVVIEGKCVIAPTVMAELNQRFIVEGLGGKKEADRVTKALNEKRKK